MKRDSEVDMANKISERTIDERIAVSVSQTLDKSLDDIDELSLQRLKNARAYALNQSHSHSSKSSRKWISLSVAASLAALMLIPLSTHRNLLNISGDQDLEIVSQDVPYSAEEMDDIDMLMALEDFDA